MARRAPAAPGGSARVRPHRLRPRPRDRRSGAERLPRPVPTRGGGRVNRPALDAAIAKYLQAVEQGWRDVCEPREPLDPIEVGDASRFLAAITEGALTLVHADPAAPQFVPWITPDRRWADNGRDSMYWMAPVDGAHRYRVHGRRGSECYLSFTVYAGSPGHPEGV